MDGNFDHLRVAPAAGTADIASSIKSQSPAGFVAQGQIPCPGSEGAIFALNDVQILDETITRPTDQIGNATVQGWSLYHRVKAGFSGGRIAMQVGLQIDGPSDPANKNQCYQAAYFQALSNSGDGGSDTTPRGSLYGFGSIAITTWPAKYLYNVTSYEADVQMQAGSSCFYKSAIQACSVPGDAVQGSAYDCAYAVGAGPGAVGFRTGWLIGPMHGAQPLGPSSTVMLLAGTCTVLRGLDFRQFAFSDFAFASPGFRVNGDGAVVAKGIMGHNGSDGTDYSNLINWYWHGADLHAWVDTTDLGPVVLKSQYDVLAARVAAIEAKLGM